MFNNIMKYKLLLSVVFVSFLINKETLAIVTKSTGDVKYKNYLSNEFSNELKMGSQLFNNDLIVTDSDGFVKFSYLDDGTTIKIHHDSELYVRGQINKKSISKRINMSNGLLKLDVSKQNDDEFMVITPTSVASVKGTSFILESNEDGDSFFGYEGTVEIRNKESNKIVKLSKNLKVTSTNDGTINSEIVTPVDINPIEIFIEMDEEEQPVENYFIDETEIINELIIKVYNSDGEEREIIIKYNE
tara:strand:- start:12456 stop:13190 length:735 start_codon:yes stop_codon:yes gene_type:complete